MIKYSVVKCSTSFGRTQQDTMKTFDVVEDAIKFHKEQKETGFTWYQILVESK